MDLKPSRLGTRKYWDDFYALEIRNYEATADTGECWFDDSGAQTKIVDFVRGLGTPLSVLDLGTGNGQLLFALRDEGIEGPFLGVDYSPASVAFASRIAEAEHPDVEFQTVDFLCAPQWTDRQFDLVLDKGTLDAIALSGQTYDGVPAPVHYVKCVLPLVKPGGTLVLTSCNFTEPELASLVKRPYETIEYPRFSFGGQEGSTVVTMVFTV